jgi:hypothetical protein
MPSIGPALVALGRTTLGTSNRPHKHRGPTVQRSILRTFGTRNSNDGPQDSSRDPRTGQQSKNGSQGRKHPLDAREVQPFYTEEMRGGSSRTPTSTVVRGPDVDENNDISTTRRVKRFVKTKVVGTVQIGLRNLSSEVEEEVPMNFGYEEQLLGDDEMTDSDGPDREEAPSDDDVVITSAATSTNGPPNANRRSQRRRKASQ